MSLNTLPLDDILVCYHDDSDNFDCRKPLPGLFNRTRDKHGIDLERSYMVGDRWRDVAAGKSAGCRTIFIDYGYVEPRPASPSNFYCKSLKEAAEWILETELILARS